MLEWKEDDELGEKKDSIERRRLYIAVDNFKVDQFTSHVPSSLNRGPFESRRPDDVPRVLVPSLCTLESRPRSKHREKTHHLIVRLYFLSRVLSPSLLCPRLDLPLPSFTHSCLPLALAYRPPSVFTSALRSLSCRQTQTILLSSPHVPLGYPTPTFLFISPLPTANIPVGSPRLPPIQSTDCSPLTLPRTTIPSSTWTLIQNLRKRLLVHRQSKCISILPSYTFPTRPRRPFVSLANLFSYQI